MKKFRVLVSFLLIAIFILAVTSVARADFGTNPWSATFFPTTTLSGSGTVVTGINGINFNWGTGVPIVNGAAVAGMPADNFSARFTSTQSFVAGTYQFIASSDDGIRVTIDGQVVLDKFFGRPLTNDQFSRVMTAGSHNITVEYFEGTDQAIVQFQWFPNQPVNNAAAPVRDYFASSTISLSWTRISWATGYEIEVAKTKTFGTADLVDQDDTLTADTLFRVTTVPGNGLYYWRVRAKKPTGDWGTWSVPYPFIAAP